MSSAAGGEGMDGLVGVSTRRDAQLLELLVLRKDLKQKPGELGIA